LGFSSISVIDALIAAVFYNKTSRS